MSAALVRSELRKVTSTRLWWGLLIGVVIYTAIQSGANAALAGQDPGAGQPRTPALDTAQAIRTVYAGSAFQGAYIFAMILGITGMTGEYRYQTLTPTFLATPRRPRVVVAKMLAHLVVGIGYGMAAVLVAVFVTFLVEPLATFILSANDLDSIVQWLPTNASTALTSPGGGFVDYLAWWVGGLVLLGYAALLAGVGMLLSTRRDVT
jgi:ABC-2 type transport system permease protein